MEDYKNEADLNPDQQESLHKTERDGDGRPMLDRKVFLLRPLRHHNHPYRWAPDNSWWAHCWDCDKRVGPMTGKAEAIAWRCPKHED